MRERKTPLIIDPAERALPDAPEPAEAPVPDDTASLAGATAVVAAGAARRSLLGRAVWWSLGALALLATGLAAEQLIGALFARYEVLGWAGGLLLGVVVLGCLGFALRELAALSRLRRIEELRRLGEAAAEGSGSALERLLRGLEGLYRHRPAAVEAISQVHSARADTPDAEARLEIAERRIFADLDREAERAVSRAARNVAALTAFIPLALVDVAAVFWVNLRMIRQVATIYGGRAGFVGSWRLFRAVAAHLAATGAIAATDDLLGPMVGGGVLGKLSRRFGEAAVNAALTARVGVGAIEVCRPLGFHAQARPRARKIVLAALKDWKPQKSEQMNSS